MVIENILFQQNLLSMSKNKMLTLIINNTQPEQVLILGIVTPISNLYDWVEDREDIGSTHKESLKMITCVWSVI